MVDIGPICLLFNHFLISLVYGHLHSSSVSYLEAVHYDRESLHHQHRTKRSTGELVHLQFEAFSRKWSVKLKRDESIFHNNIIVENSKGPVTYDFDSAYTGKIDGKVERPKVCILYGPLTYDFDSAYTGKIDGERSHVFGTVTTTGHFEGQIQLRNDSFVIEKASRHNVTDQDTHTVIYNVKDVNIPKESHLCGLNGKNTQPKPELREKINTHDSMDTDFKLRYTSGLIDKHRRYRRAVDPNKKICELYIQVDHTLFFRYNNATDDVIANINNHVMAVNSIFNGVDFDSDNTPDSIGFSIKRIKIYDDPTAPGYKYSGNHGVNSMLYLHSEENYDQFCLSYIFTYRDFDNGILGLAWTAEPGTSGGLCSRYTLYTDGRLSLNTGIVTNLNYGNDVTTAVSYVTFAHEIGHNFGSLHDESSNPTCAPGGTGGNYIMFAQATAGTKSNNVKFSPCSISSMAPMVATRGRDTANGCFVEYSSATCGNKVVESGEQCDCGWDDDCTDPCCYPTLSATGPDSAKACQYRTTATCSPSEGVCCNPTTCSNYLPLDNKVCRTNSSCLDEAICNGGLTCPDSTESANGTVCDDEKVCYFGQCSGQVCEAHGYQPCQCEPTTAGNWKDELLCSLCCTDPDDNTCKTADQLSNINVAFTKAVPGTPCNKFLGYCDVFHICREVDPSGPLSKLKNFFLNGELIDKVKEFLTEYWYVAIAGGVGLIIIFVLMIKCCSKSTQGKVQPEPRRVSVEPSRTRY
ncbi:disintegrin and metalloproteinase domain-containing protein 10-like [Mytilus californianus]|uniref:disintegrin and metalloproteinase domain-containing protein 10-like n=1 Tax=Mytilus californianus TaxID=6549 RepID=UPI002246A248|nr:disintegrin and metalloproteinase domain-containing protein 10-like [Mytilus californianus]